MPADLHHRAHHNSATGKHDEPQSPGSVHDPADLDPSASRGTPFVFSVLSGLVAVATVVLAASLPRH